MKESYFLKNNFDVSIGNSSESLKQMIESCDIFFIAKAERKIIM